MTENRCIYIKTIEKVSNTLGLFSTYSTREYASAGVVVLRPGILYNSGYSFKGKVISTLEANTLVRYYFIYGHVAPDVVTAKRKVREADGDGIPNYSGS